MLEEDWEGAARALMPMQLEGGSRVVSDDEKLNVYMQIVRLFLEVSFLVHSIAGLSTHTSTPNSVRRMGPSPNILYPRFPLTPPNRQGDPPIHASLSS